MVVAQISVGEDIVADRLARPQAAAMADHQPDFGAEHGEMVADRLGVGRADADIDEGDSAAIGRDQMVGRHLHLAPAARGDLGDRIRRVAGDEHAAGRGQGLVGAVLAPQLLDRPADELVDVADIVGEQQIALGVLDRSAGIMAQAGEAEIDPAARRTGPAAGRGCGYNPRCRRRPRRRYGKARSPGTSG